MNREEHLNNILQLADEQRNIVLQLSTGVGKTRCALELLKKWKCKEVLIVLFYNNLQKDWENEIIKWNIQDIDFTFVNYKSLHKYVKDWDCIIFDEVHHYTENADSAIYQGFRWKYMIALSATIPKKVKDRLNHTFHNPYFYRIGLRTAIEDEILPDPEVKLIQLRLDNKEITEEIILNKNKKDVITLDYQHRFTKIKDKKIIIRCTQQQYYDYYTDKVEYFKKQYLITNKDYQKNVWLQTAGHRLKWLSDLKTQNVIRLLNLFKDERVIVFCSSISQAEEINYENCISSNKKNTQELLDRFNNKEINHITCVDMLNEGKNLKDCKIGIFAGLTNSDIRIKQQLGRTLRHKKPKIIIPYYTNTRDEEIVAKMVENYNPELISVVTDYSELTI